MGDILIRTLEMRNETTWGRHFCLPNKAGKNACPTQNETAGVLWGAPAVGVGRELFDGDRVG
jgi:hypothetical protein